MIYPLACRDPRSGGKSFTSLAGLKYYLITSDVVLTRWHDSYADGQFRLRKLLHSVSAISLLSLSLQSVIRNSKWISLLALSTLSSVCLAARSQQGRKREVDTDLKWGIQTRGSSIKYVSRGEDTYKPKCKHSMGGCVNLVLRISQNAH